MADGTASPPSGLAIYSRLLAYIKPLWWALFLAILGFTLFATASTYFNELVRILIDSISLGNTITAAERMRIPLLLMGVVLMRAVGGFLGSYFMSLLAFRIVHRLRCQVMEAFLHLPLSFHERQASGHMLSTVTFNVSQISTAVSDAIAVMLREGLTVIALVIY